MKTFRGIIIKKLESIPLSVGEKIDYAEQKNNEVIVFHHSGWWKISRDYLVRERG